MDHVEEPLHILLVGKEGQPCLTSYISSFFFFFNYVFLDLHLRGRKGEHIGGIILREEGGFLLLWLLYWCLHMIVQHVLDMQVSAPNGELKKCHDFEHLFVEYGEERS